MGLFIIYVYWYMGLDGVEDAVSKYHDTTPQQQKSVNPFISPFEIISIFSPTTLYYI